MLRIDQVGVITNAATPATIQNEFSTMGIDAAFVVAVEKPPAGAPGTFKPKVKILTKAGLALTQTNLRKPAAQGGEVLEPGANEVLQITQPDGTLQMCIPLPGKWIWI